MTVRRRTKATRSKKLFKKLRAATTRADELVRECYSDGYHVPVDGTVIVSAEKLAQAIDSLQTAYNALIDLDRGGEPIPQEAMAAAG